MLVLWLEVINMTPQQKLLFLFYVKNISVSKLGGVNQIPFSFEMRRYASFAEMNMILATVTKAQLLPFDSWNMCYPSLKFCNSYLSKNFTLIRALFFLINRYCLSCVFFFFIWFFNPIDYRDNPPLAFFSN